VLDRESGFADEAVVELLRRRYVPVALDVWYEERRKDPAGDFFRKVVFQREGMGPDRTTQGFYIFGPDGALISGWNNRDLAKLRERLKRTLDDYRPPKAEKLDAKADAEFARTPPAGGLVVDVHTRILKGEWPDAADAWQKIFRTASGRDHLWITQEEVAALSHGEFPKSLATRIARFHCIDDTRGEPPLWEKAEVRELRCDAKPAKGGSAIDGAITEPSYRAGVLREQAIRAMQRLESSMAGKVLPSIAVGHLGPPKLSKLLIEAYLLREALGHDIAKMLAAKAADMQQRVEAWLARNAQIVSLVTTIGIPLLRADDGQLRLTRGPRINIPPAPPDDAPSPIDSDAVDAVDEADYRPTLF